MKNLYKLSSEFPFGQEFLRKNGYIYSLEGQSEKGLLFVSVTTKKSVRVKAINDPSFQFKVYK